MPELLAVGAWDRSWRGELGQPAESMAHTLAHTLHLQGLPSLPQGDSCDLSSFFRKLFTHKWLSAEEESSKGSEVKEMLVLILLRLDGQRVSR